METRKPVMHQIKLLLMNLPFNCWVKTMKFNWKQTKVLKNQMMRTRSIWWGFGKWAKKDRTYLGCLRWGLECCSIEEILWFNIIQTDERISHNNYLASPSLSPPLLLTPPRKRHATYERNSVTDSSSRIRDRYAFKFKACGFIIFIFKAHIFRQESCYLIF